MPHKEADRFLEVVQNLPNLKAGELHMLEIAIPERDIRQNTAEGIFNFGQAKPTAVTAAASTALAS